ncbi:MAG TPA: hypothetical protein VLH94_04370 [Spirochaetia bacterium]|nr:hypothetical protein [Spirochaetia bacterium]
MAIDYLFYYSFLLTSSLLVILGSERVVILLHFPVYLSGSGREE